MTSMATWTQNVFAYINDHHHIYYINPFIHNCHDVFTPVIIGNKCLFKSSTLLYRTISEIALLTITRIVEHY